MISDDIGNVIIIVKLKGDNYDSWIKVVINIFKVKNKLGFVDETVSEYADRIKDMFNIFYKILWKIFFFLFIEYYNL